MASNKYKIVKGKTGKSKKVVVQGVKKILYKKTGSQKMYVMSKGKMMNLVKYRKMKMKKATSATSTKKRKGGSAVSDYLSELVGTNNPAATGGGKRKGKGKGKGKGKKGKKGK
tara:strand:+ start:2629 stop:2967 length:339 start_codon:yes stop_codon:yes gene_type:complete